MLKLLAFVSPTFYLRLSPERLTIRNVRTGAFISEVPEIAILRGAKKPQILGVGAEASLHRATPSVEVINPFSHPRTMVGDFIAGEQVVKAFIRKLTGSGWLATTPRVVFHPLGDPAGGFTQVEIRAFREMVLGAGASDVLMWQGPELTDEQVSSNKLPATGRLLD
ncbi:rod shape-determining protein [Polaromonas sp. A23]|uniref:rod shape-determining protein n=1 Tax=Polaromonas sp. A23 TaxID=1944133 RepID=UPI00098782D7|nr:rod shape-determining protein [Polaromonas sp. A23]OOG39692.1 rod shape-determining protein MreB [Polaromonas sp. A23]